MSQQDIVDSELYELRDLLSEALIEVEREYPRIQEVKRILGLLREALNHFEQDVR